MRCDEFRELAPEIALGIADGEERAEALRHLSTCAECRRLVEELSEVTDELLLVAPAQEPPVGFESRVVDTLWEQAPQRRRRARWWTPRWLVPRLVPALATAAITAAALVAVYDDDRQTAERYRDALEQANGQYFRAQPLVDPSGAESGVVFGYQGEPSWVFVTVDAAHRDEVRSGELVTESGRTIPLRSLELDSRQGSWGGAIPVNLYDVASLRLLGERERELLEASFPGG
jgi:hypothetical protein